MAVVGEYPLMAPLRRRAAEIRHTLARHPGAVDTVLAVFLAVLAVPRLATVADERGHLQWPPQPLTVALVLATTLPLAWRRRRPLVVLAVTGVATVLHEPLTGTAVPDFLGMLIAVWTVGAVCDVRTAAITNGTVLVVVPTALLPDVSAASTDELLRNYILFAIVWALGVQHRRHVRAHALAVAERAARLEIERDDLTRRAVAGERVRIARELHDVIAHHVTVMVVQADVARQTMATCPDQAGESLHSVMAMGRQALNEMRRMLGILRSAGDSGGDEPQPDLCQLDRLVEQMREAGLRVELQVVGKVRRLEPGVSLSAYRIIQEALTNTLRHAGRGATAMVEVISQPRLLEVRVLDDGGDRPSRREAAPNPGVGRGLVGMRERIGLLGGELRTSPRPERGFDVWARIPVEAPAP